MNIITRDDVAKHAGVSVAVVSYVVNNKQNVKESTRQKVLQAIDELGYKPNLTARSLKTKKTNQLGVLVNHIGNPFETGILLGLEQNARRNQQFLFIQTYHREEEDSLKTIFMGRTDGIILLGQTLKASTIHYFAKTDVPLYSISKPVSSHPHVKYVDIQWNDAMLKVIRHLKELGHTKIGFMGDSHQERHLYVRYVSFLQAMKEEGLAFDESWLIHGEGTLELAHKAMSEQIKRYTPSGLPFSAIICANDLMAVGTMSACRDHGIGVPEQLSIAACEDILMTSHTSPTLTTIHYPRPEIGSIAIEMILQNAAGAKPIDCIVNADLIVRQSTGPVHPQWQNK